MTASHVKGSFILRPLTFFRRAGLLGALALGALLSTAPDARAQVRDPYHTAPKDTVSNDVYQGWKQYELNCARCHGEFGVGTSFAPALVVSLKEGGTVPSREMFIQTVCSGRPDRGMPSWCALGLEFDKMERIYLYLKDRADGKLSPGRPAVRADT